MRTLRDRASLPLMVMKHVPCEIRVGSPFMATWGLLRESYRVAIPGDLSDYAFSALVIFSYRSPDRFSSPFSVSSA